MSVASTDLIVSCDQTKESCLPKQRNVDPKRNLRTSPRLIIRKLSKSNQRKGYVDATCLVGFRDLLELGLGLLFVTWVLVRVPSNRQPPVRLLEILIGGTSIHLQYVVVIEPHVDPNTEQAYEQPIILIDSSKNQIRPPPPPPPIIPWLPSCKDSTFHPPPTGSTPTNSWRKNERGVNFNNPFKTRMKNYPKGNESTMN